MKTYIANISISILMILVCFSEGVTQQEHRPDRGFVRHGAYDSSGVENINVSNGNLNLTVPLASLPSIAGGKLGFTLNAYYNSKMWDVYSDQRFYHEPGEPPIYYFAPLPIGPDEGGWRIGEPYWLEQVDALQDANKYTDINDPDIYNLTQTRRYKTYFLKPDGSRIEVRPFTTPFSPNSPQFNGYYKETPQNITVPLKYHSMDGSFMTVTMYPASHATLHWEANMKDGSKVINHKTLGQILEDTNGNQIRMYSDVNGKHYEDAQTGRKITLKVNQTSGFTEVSYPTVGGTIQTVEIEWGMTSPRGMIFEIHRPSNGYGIPSCDYQEYVGWDFPVVRRITFPQTEYGEDPPEYNFEYNSDENASNTPYYKPTCSGTYVPLPFYPTVGAGEMSKMLAPSGAIHNYEYNINTQTLSNNFITKKVIEHDGLESEWNYLSSINGGSVTNPDGSSYFSNKGVGGLLGGMIYRELISSHMIKYKKWDSKVFTAAYTLGPDGHVTFNPVVTHEFTEILDDNGDPTIMSAKAFQYDFNGNLTQTIEYDWFSAGLVTRSGIHGVPTGIPVSATVLRTTNHTYHNSPTSNSSNDVYAKTSNKILTAIKDTTVGSAITRYSYDSASYGTAPTNGNVTKVESWDNINSQWISTLTGYDTYGNVTSRTDPNGNVTQIFYEDATYAMPTKTIVNPNNGSGTQISTATYDFYTGLPLTTTDINGATSTFDYTNHLLGAVDPFGRVGTASAPVINVDGVNQRKTVKTYYEDAARRTRTESDLFAQGDGLVKARVSRDQLGRTFLTEKNENGSSSYSIFSETVYKTEDRVVLQSNARRSSSETTDGWSRVTTDLLGRTIESATFKGTSQPPVSGTNANWTGSSTSEYSMNSMTVTDPAGKQRRSVSNALGQVIRVDEPDGSGSLGNLLSPTQPTHYTYDALGHLARVNQGVQNRYFMYDTLGRLLRVRQPEQIVNSAFNTSGNPLNNNWTGAFTYDLNGNPLTATDANGVTITNTYDGLNRVVTRSYSDTTPTVTYTYEDTNVPYSKGRLTKVSSSISETRYTEFDIIGNLKESEQVTDGEIYTSKYKYYLSGPLSEQTYPSGRVVKTALNDTGLISHISSRVENGAYKSYASSLGYTPSGVLTHIKLGNGRWEGAKQNNLGQVTELKLGVGYGGEDLWKLSYEYGEFDTNGDVDTTKNSGNIARQTMNFNGLANPFIQEYKYDSLDRIAEAKETVNSNQTWIQEFGYDRYGNRTSRSQNVLGLQMVINETTLPSIDANTNRFSSTGDYEYDEVGNLIGDIDGREFVFNGDNKQVEVKDNLNNTIGIYLYDGNGKRVKKITASEETVFVYDGSGRLVAEFTYNEPPDDPDVYFTTIDMLGSPRVVTDKTGDVVSRRDFMPFGEEISSDVTYRTTAVDYGVGDSIRQKFTGYERDNETGLDFAEARYYNNFNGRFTAVDPLLASGRSANPQTFNRYAYVMNRPLNLIDPTGLDPCASSVEGANRRPDDCEEIKQKSPTVKIRGIRIFNGTFPDNEQAGATRGQKTGTTTGTPSNNPIGGYISVDYTLLDADGKPLAGVQVHEELSVIFTGLSPDEDGTVYEFKSGGPPELRLVSESTTDEDGNFTDEPLGASNNAASVSWEATQTLFIKKGDERIDIVTNKINITTDAKVENNKLVGGNVVTITFSNPDYKKTFGPMRIRPLR